MDGLNRQGPGDGERSGKAIRFSVVRNPARAGEVSALRRLAYGDAGRAGPGGLSTEESDPRDLQAYVVIAETEHEVVGSVRVIPPMPGPILQANELEGDLDLIPPRPELSEGGWGCVHPHHQGKGLFWKLAAHMLILGHDLGATKMVAGTAGDLWRYWRRCGFRKLDLSYRGVHSGIPYTVMLADLDRVLRGEEIAPEFADVLLPLAADPDRAKPPQS